jgi:hypothetical protein
MPSVIENIAEQVKLGLVAGAIPGVVDHISRAREDAISYDEGDWLNVRIEDNAQRTFSEAIDDNELTVAIDIHVRGDVWETKADAYAVQVHPIVIGRNYAGAGIVIARAPRLTDQSWNAEPGDNTPGRRTMQYAFRFLSLAADITKQP